MTWAYAWLGEPIRLILRVSSPLALASLPVAGDGLRIFSAAPARDLFQHRFRARVGPRCREFLALVIGVPFGDSAVVGDHALDNDIVEASPGVFSSGSVSPVIAESGGQCPSGWSDAGECVDRFPDAQAWAGEPPGAQSLLTLAALPPDDDGIERASATGAAGTLDDNPLPCKAQGATFPADAAATLDPQFLAYTLSLEADSRPRPPPGGADATRSASPPAGPRSPSSAAMLRWCDPRRAEAATAWPLDVDAWNDRRARILHCMHQHQGQHQQQQPPPAQPHAGDANATRAGATTAPSRKLPRWLPQAGAQQQQG